MEVQVGHPLPFHFLFEKAVTKGEDVVFHDDSECLHDSVDRDSVGMMVSEILSNSVECLLSWDIRIHGDGVGCEDTSVGWPGPRSELLFEVEATFEVGAD